MTDQIRPLGELAQEEQERLMAAHRGATQHTDAPWEVVRTGPARRFEILTANGGVALATTHGQPSQEADAALMAQAPILLRLLEKTLQYVPPRASAALHAEAREAIARAKNLKVW